jgi:formate hydrogenlyase subunit 3/multisubunit Na+/H+ antiporter MnhD subunit
MVESRQTEVLSIVGVFTVLAFIFVVVRVYSRYLGRNFGWDDYLIIGGMVILFGQTLAMWKCKSLLSLPQHAKVLMLY